MKDLEALKKDFRSRFVLAGWMNPDIHFSVIERWLADNFVQSEPNETVEPTEPIVEPSEPVESEATNDEKQPEQEEIKKDEDIKPLEDEQKPI
ncbi:MAG: hypothetical protein WC346_01380 [Methanogenium sp.]|jgi:hypothetical protein